MPKNSLLKIVEMFCDGCRNFINSLFEQYVTDSDDTATDRLFNVNSKNTIMLSLALNRSNCD